MHDIQIQAALERILDTVEEQGWAVQTVLTNPRVQYTVGLSFVHGHPELVVSGLAPEHGIQVLDRLARKLIAGELQLVDGSQQLDVFEGYPAKWRKLGAAEAANLRIVSFFLGEDCRNAWQLIWPGPNGVFPGERGAEEAFVAMQNLQLVFQEPNDENPAH